jgi:hypothetical protein
MAGRPRKSVSADNGIENGPSLADLAISPADAIGGGDSGTGGATGTGTEGTGEARRKPGPKPGSKKSASAARHPVDAHALEGMLYTVHMMLAGMTKTQELMLSQDEAKSLSVASANVARHYDVGASQVMLDWTALAMCIGAIYGPRIIAIRINNAVRRPQKPKSEPQPEAPVDGPIPFDPTFGMQFN